MGSYSPRHLQRESKILNKVGRRGVAVAAAGAVVVPLAGMESASAAPSTGLAQTASHVAAVGHVSAAGHVAATSHLTTSVRIGPTVRYGSHGYAVKVVQRKLGGLAVDGIFGPRTRAKVWAFQRRHHLVVDGIVGRHTWTALGGYPRSTSPAPAPSRSGVVNIALSLRGVPYSWGGSSPSQGFDCSGFTSYVFRRAGISIPRTASAQAARATRVSNPRPGDLMFWGYPAYHVGIYLGHGKMIAARRPGTVVGIQSVWGNPYYGRI